MKERTVKHDIFDQFASVAKALGHANRLELLELLAQGERSVDTLAKLTGLTVGNTSQHLQHLRQSGLVTSRKEGLFVYYQLVGDEIVGLLGALRGVAEKHLAEVDRLVNTYLKSKDSLEPVSARELLDRARNGQVIVLDVRPKEEYADGHIPGAVNIPLEELEKHLELLGNDKEIVAYCRGPYCLLAYDAVAKLRSLGVSARRLEDGYPEWKASGLPVAQ